MKKMVIWLVCISCLAFSFHPIHISVTDIEYDQKEEELEIMVRIFTDDLEKAIRQHKKDETVDLLKPRGSTTDKLLEDYITHHLAIRLDNTEVDLSYLGHEDEGQALICYILASDVKNWKTIEIKNDILMELFDDQSNLVHVTVNGKVRSMRLLNSTSTGTLTF